MCVVGCPSVPPGRMHGKFDPPYFEQTFQFLYHYDIDTPPDPMQLKIVKVFQFGFDAVRHWSLEEMRVLRADLRKASTSLPKSFLF